MARIPLITILQFILWGTGSSQELRFQPIPLHEAVNGRPVTDIIQTDDGTLWIGTERGLIHFDGFTSEFYGANENALAGTHIVDLELDRDGILWVAHDASGITRLDLSTMSFEHFRHNGSDPASIANDQGIHIKDFDEDHLLIGLERETIVFMNKHDRSFSYWDGVSPIHPAHAIHETLGEERWCFNATRIDDARWHINMLHDPSDRVIDANGNIVDSLLKVSQRDWYVPSNSSYSSGYMFIGGWQPRLFIVKVNDPNERKLVEVGSNITCTLPWNDDQVLVGTELHGLYLIDVNTGRIIEHVAHLSNSHINCLFEDDHDKLWVGTDRGLYLFDPLVWNFNTFDLRSTGKTSDGLKVYDMQFRNGLVEVLSSNGIIRYDPGTQAVTNTVVRWDGKPLQITCLTELSDGQLILGAEEGFGLYDADKNELTEIPLVHLTRRNASNEPMLRPSLEVFYQVRGITDYGNPGQFLISALGFGSALVDLADNRYLSGLLDSEGYSGGVGSLVNKVLKTRNGNYWEALRNGVRRSEATINATPRPIASYEHDPDDPNTLPGHDARDIIEAADGTIWIACLDGGLASIRDNKVIRYRNPRSTGNSLMGLVIDDQQRLWCTSPNGLEVFDTKNSTFFHVPINVGVLSTELHGPIAILPNGSIATFSGTSVITFNPSKFSFLEELIAPQVISVEVSDKDITDRIEKGKIELLYQENFLKVNTTIPWLRGEERPSVQYQLGENSEDWQDAHEDGSILFNSLATGEHQLSLRAAFADGRMGPVMDWGTLTVLPPFYLRWWFIAVVLLLIAAVVYLWHRRTLQQALRLQDVRNRIASDLHDEVGSSLSSITLGSQLAARLSKSQNKDVQQLLQRIGKTSSESLQSISDIVWAVDPRNDEGEAMVRRMQSIGQDLLETKGIDLQLHTTGNVDGLKLPMNARKDLLLIYKEALHNASKYSEATVVDVGLHRINGSLKMNIEDNGKGFDMEFHREGHGLHSMQRRATELGTELKIKSAPGKGTTIGLVVDITRIRD